MQIRLTASPRDFIQAVLCLRVIAVAGQIAVIVVAFRWLHVVMPMQALGGVIGLLAVTALLSAVRLRASWPVTELEVTLQLFVDVGALAALLYMSGGYTNPFASLLLFPVTLAAVGLAWRYAVTVAVACLGAYGFLMFYCLNLGFPGRDVRSIYRLHCLGAGVNFALSATLLAGVLGYMAMKMRARDRELSELREQTLRHEHLNALGLLAAGAAHELSTPLATMAVVVSEMQTRRQGQQEFHESLDVLNRQIHSCKSRLTTLLQAVGLTRSADRHRVRLREVLKDLLETWRMMRPGVRLDLVWDENAGDPYITVDESFSQSITNLLNNAADASATSHSDRVALLVAADAARVRITIEDEGPGLSKDLMQKAGKTVFTTKPGGFGLGLVLSHTSLNRLGGELTLNSRAAGGTCTAIHIPLATQGALSG